jgi:hypothetical protein
MGVPSQYAEYLREYSDAVLDAVAAEVEAS